MEDIEFQEDIEFKKINNVFEIEIGKQISGSPYADAWDYVLTKDGKDQKLKAIQEILVVPVAVGKKYMLSRQFHSPENPRDQTLNIEKVYDDKCREICEFVKSKSVQLFLNGESIIKNRRPTFATLITRHNHVKYGYIEPADDKTVLIYISNKNESGENTGTFTIYSTGDYDYNNNECFVDFGIGVKKIDINKSVSKVVKFDVLEIVDTDVPSIVFDNNETANNLIDNHLVSSNNLNNNSSASVAPERASVDPERASVAPELKTSWWPFVKSSSVDPERASVPEPKPSWWSSFGKSVKVAPDNSKGGRRKRQRKTKRRQKRRNSRKKRR